MPPPPLPPPFPPPLRPQFLLDKYNDGGAYETSTRRRHIR